MFLDITVPPHFTLVTDHHPLVSILNPEKGLPAVTAARLHWYIPVLISGTRVPLSTQMLMHFHVSQWWPTCRWHKWTRRKEGHSQLQTLPVEVAELGRTTTIKGPGVSKGVSAYSGGMATQNYTEEVIKPCFE